MIFRYHPTLSPVSFINRADRKKRNPHHACSGVLGAMELGLLVNLMPVEFTRIGVSTRLSEEDMNVSITYCVR